MTLRKGALRAGTRWFLLWGAVAALLLVAAATSLAVHDVSVFQLDVPADAQVDEGATAHAEDWDVICEANPSTCTIKAGFETGVVSTADSSAHVDDGALNATIFTGGGSKDIHDISSWAWKDESGGLPDKDNLLHAYAAHYIVPSSPECPGETGTTDGSEDCSVIYFGSDRFDNSGDATQAFWFLQSEIALGDNKVGGGFGFVGTHQDGDLLVISEFSNGGENSTITVFEWMAGSLVPLAGGEDQLCGFSTPDPFCGTVNSGTEPIDSPWPFLDKFGSTQFRQGELYESGINLSHPTINLADACFASFVAETRSSTSTSAQLKDFVIGSLQSCEVDINTTPSSTSITLGDSVTDTAVVSGSGVANPPTPTGTVTFSICGPTELDTNGLCSTGGTQVGDPVLLAETVPGTASATSASFTPDEVGTWCWRGFYDPTGADPDDPNYDEATDFDASECLTVTDTSDTSTAQNWLPNDSATITSTGGSTLAGNVTFNLYDDGTCGDDGGSVVYGPEVVDVATGTGTADSRTVTTSNTAFVVTSANNTGAYSWEVIYSGTSGISGSEACESTSITITD